MSTFVVHIIYFFNKSMQANERTNERGRGILFVFFFHKIMLRESVFLLVCIVFIHNMYETLYTINGYNIKYRGESVLILGYRVFVGFVACAWTYTRLTTLSFSIDFFFVPYIRILFSI